MPELPEVETVVRTLRPQILGKTISSVWTSGLSLRMAKRLDEAALRDCCVGAKIRAVRRRGKFILIHLSRVGGQQIGILVHLGMTGRLRVQNQREERLKTHPRGVGASARERITFRGSAPLRLGAGSAEHRRAPGSSGARLGSAQRAGRGKTAQPAGVVARAHQGVPARPAPSGRAGQHLRLRSTFSCTHSSATRARRAQGKAELLVCAIRETLQTGIDNCGTSFRDFVDSTGAPGKNIKALRVYAREGEKCFTCAGLVRRLVDGGRSTFYCSRCQKR